MLPLLGVGVDRSRDVAIVRRGVGLVLSTAPAKDLPKEAHNGSLAPVAGQNARHQRRESTHRTRVVALES